MLRAMVRRGSLSLFISLSLTCYLTCCACVSETPFGRWYAASHVNHGLNSSAASCRKEMKTKQLPVQRPWLPPQSTHTLSIDIYIWHIYIYIYLYLSVFAPHSFSHLSCFQCIFVFLFFFFLFVVLVAIFPRLLFCHFFFVLFLFSCFIFPAFLLILTLHEYLSLLHLLLSIWCYSLKFPSFFFSDTVF